MRSVHHYYTIVRNNPQNLSTIIDYNIHFHNIFEYKVWKIPIDFLSLWQINNQKQLRYEEICFMCITMHDEFNNVCSKFRWLLLVLL